MDDRLRNAIWNFMEDHYFHEGALRNNRALDLLFPLWTDVAGERSDELSSGDEFFAYRALANFRSWYFAASWNEVYDALEYLLRERRSRQEISDANAMLSREGSAYRFVGDVIVPITNDEELAVVEAGIQHSGSFDGASQHIAQAVTLLSNRDNPDVRNAIKESISAVESAVRAASGDPKVDFKKGLQKLEGHHQLKQAWTNMYNWTSDESGIRHGIKETPQVGLPEARYMVVARSAFVNYFGGEEPRVR